MEFTQVVSLLSRSELGDVEKPKSSVVLKAIMDRVRKSLSIGSADGIVNICAKADIGDEDKRSLIKELDDKSKTPNKIRSEYLAIKRALEVTLS